MIHHSTKGNPNGDHYAVGSSNTPYPPGILVQLQEDGNQARTRLTIDEARHLAELLLSTANTIDWLYTESM